MFLLDHAKCNAATGEDVRNLWRADADRMRLPAEDFWIFDSRLVALRVEVTAEPTEVLRYAVPYDRFALRPGLPMAGALAHEVTHPRHAAVARDVVPAVGVAADDAAWRAELRLRLGREGAGREGGAHRVRDLGRHPPAVARAVAVRAVVSGAEDADRAGPHRAHRLRDGEHGTPCPAAAHPEHPAWMFRWSTSTPTVASHNALRRLRCAAREVAVAR